MIVNRWLVAVLIQISKHTFSGYIGMKFFIGYQDFLIPDI